MTELANASARLTATGLPTARAQSDSSNGTADARGRGIKLMRVLAGINLGLVALQAVSAGFLLSGFEYAVATHAAGATALQVGVLTQAVAAIVLWRRGRVPAWVARMSIGLFVMVFLQTALGFRKQYWLHVPIGVGIFGGLTRQLNRLTGARHAILESS